MAGAPIVLMMFFFHKRVELSFIYTITRCSGGGDSEPIISTGRRLRRRKQAASVESLTSGVRVMHV